jgi:hypothetical protein
VTLDLPATAGTIQVSGAAISGTTGSFSDNLSFNSGYGSAAVAYGCRAWVNFNGTGTVAIRASGNVSSITDNGTGSYSVNFTTAMPDANYATNVSIGNGTPGVGDNVGFIRVYQGTASSQQICTVNTASTAFEDYVRVYVSIFR